MPVIGVPDRSTEFTVSDLCVVGGGGGVKLVSRYATRFPKYDGSVS
jgi:hypothetical protein